MREGEQGNDKAGYSEKGRNRVRMPEVQNTDPTLTSARVSAGQSSKAKIALCACPKYNIRIQL